MKLTLRGARENNLSSVDLELELGTWVSVVGRSGSGKSSLVHDTLVRESQRRFLSTLSPRAQLRLGRLGRPEFGSLEGLPVAIAVGQRDCSPHPRSTLGTLSGALDWLRLLYARDGTPPEPCPSLSRSHFSFNHPLGACPDCQGMGVEDELAEDLLIADPQRSIREGALRPTLKNGYTVYSQVTLEVMDQICRAHDFDVDTPWQSMTRAQQEVILYGTRALKVPFGKHSLESRLRWEGITARPREEGYYRGLIPVMEETLRRSRNDNILRYVRSRACRSCEGSRLGPIGRGTRWQGLTLPELLSWSIDRLLSELPQRAQGRVAEAVLPSLLSPLARMQRLALGHLSLDRPSGTLSGGEAQRVRLASQLRGGLSRMLVALDEPTLGLYPPSQEGLRQVLQTLRDEGNLVLAVEHDPDFVRHADRVLTLGPEAGPRGGCLLRSGPPSEHPLGQTPPASEPAPPSSRGELILRGATLHGLQDAELRVPLGTLHVVLGPSGAGKSSLVLGTLLPALQGEQGGPYQSLEGAPPGLQVQWLDARPLGRTPRSTPATWSGLMDRLRRRFAATEAARARGWKASHFSYNSRSGRCPDCEGLGVERVGLHLLEPIERACPSCSGSRYRPGIEEVQIWSRSLPSILQTPFSELEVLWREEDELLRWVRAFISLGLGYLRPGQSSSSLSRGEAQRVRLATLLAGLKVPEQLLILDEPDRGLHPEDLQQLIEALRSLVRQGHTVLAISHHRALHAAADQRSLVERGRVRPAPPLSSRPLSRSAPPQPPAPGPSEIILRGLRTHNLRDLDLEIPHGQLTAIVGVSGSGKSSLAFSTVAAEAQRRFAESLPFAVRRAWRKLERPRLREARGLTPTLALSQRSARPDPRTRAGSWCGLDLPLRLLWARGCERPGDGEEELSASHFSPLHPLGACPACSGRGQVERCDPDLLVRDPQRSILAGALRGTAAGDLFTEPQGRHLAVLRAAGGESLLQRPWSELSPEQQALALRGSGEQVYELVWAFQRGERQGEQALREPWPGFLALVEREARLRASRKSAARWRTTLVEVPCEDCGGQGVRGESLDLRLGSCRWSELLSRPLRELRRNLEDESAALSAEGQLAWEGLRGEILERLSILLELGLGGLRLDQRVAELSQGERQRLRLGGLLRAGMQGVTWVLDEPTVGLQPEELDGFIRVLSGLLQQDNTVLMVTHRRDLILASDHIIELGPGAGAEGGRLLASCPRDAWLQLDTPTTRSLRHPPEPASSVARPRPEIELRGIAAGQESWDLCLPEQGLVVISSPGGGASRALLREVIQPSLQSGRARACQSLVGLRPGRELLLASEITRDLDPLSSLELLPVLKRMLKASLKQQGLKPSALSPRSAAGRCVSCQGRGVEKTSLDVLSDLEWACPSCQGLRYHPEVLALCWEGICLEELLSSPAAELLRLLPLSPLTPALEGMVQLGLGGLSLSRRAGQLSGGEQQRLRVLRQLLRAQPGGILLLEDPGRGLHPQDLGGLVRGLRQLGQQGQLVILSAHRRELHAAADLLLRLDAEGSPQLRD